MATRSLKIELRLDVDDERFEAAKRAARKCAKQLLATAMLLTEKRPPEIALTGEDFHVGRQQIELTDDE